MAAFTSGIFSHAVTAAQTLTNPNSTSGPKPQASGSDGTSTTSTTSANISGNDFLTLLVTEMKNQDPTANNDPNQYINQLVNVNSLEQLIDINQNLTKALGDPSSKAHVASTDRISSPPTTTTSTATHPVAGSLTANSAISTSAASSNLASAKRAPGNLTMPDTAPAAANLAHALDGRRHGGPKSANFAVQTNN